MILSDLDLSTTPHFPQPCCPQKSPTHWDRPTCRLGAGSRLLGHEWDEDVDNGVRPKGLIRLSETKVDNVQAR